METANYSVLMELIIFLYVSVSLHASYCYCSFSGSRQAQSGGATLSLCKYASELAGYGVNSVIARSIFLFLYILQGETTMRRSFDAI